MGHAVALILVSVGTAVVAASALGALAMGPHPLDRLHYLTPVTSLGIPLVVAGLCVGNGWGITSGQIMVIGVLAFVAGPVLGAATGKLLLEHEEEVRPEDRR